MLQDIRYAARMMRGQPLFTSMAVLSLALGIGANTAIYSFMDSIMLRALPVQDPGSLAVFNWRTKDRAEVIHSFSGSSYRDGKLGQTSGAFPYPAYEQLRDHNSAFSSVFGFFNSGRLTVQFKDQSDLAGTQYVTGGFFAGLGVPPAVGRLLDGNDDRSGAADVAVISYGYAQRHFGDVTKAPGQSVTVNGIPFTVAGVTPPEFFGVNPDRQVDLYLPTRASVALERVFTQDSAKKFLDGNYYWLQIMGRLRPGKTLPQAEAELSPMFQRWEETTASNDKERKDLPQFFLQEGAGGLDSLRRQFSQPLYVLMTLVGLILAIACANMANLLLARATARRREMAVRLSIGASRWRVIRQLLTESVLLASLGGLLGLALAKWSIGGLTWLIANGRDNFTLRADLNWHVLLVTVGLSVATGVIFGLAPAFQSTKVDLISALKQTRAGEPRKRVHRWVRVSLSQALAVSQIAISLLLLVAAGLFVHSLTNLNSVALGFNTERLLLVTLNARQAGYKDDGLMRFYDDLQKRFSAIPGVRAATVSNYAMLGGGRNTNRARMVGESEGKLESTTVLNVGSDFFRTMEIPILLGREISEKDLFSPSHVAVVNEVFVQTFLAGANPMGRHFILNGRTPIDFEIVGVAKGTRFQSVKQDIPPVVFVPFSQNPQQTLGSMVYELRAAGDPMAAAASARQIVQQADSRIPISSILTQNKQIDQTIGQERTFAVLCTCFAVLAVLIACLGLYGMMAYRVARRTNEIGIRMALGAQRMGMIRMVLKEVFIMALIGLSIGLAGALATTRFVQSFLFQIKPNDPVALATAAALLLAAAMFAGFGPARKASRVDPWVALRDE